MIACIVGGQLIERSKDALDEIYTKDTLESERILSALEVYGAKKASEEIKFCLSEILKVCSAGQVKKLRDIVFRNGNTNAFPSVFAIILIAFHELIVRDKKKIADYEGVKTSITDLSQRIGWGRKATSPEERRKNINSVKGLIRSSFVKDKTIEQVIYSNHTSIDIEATIRRSEIELPNYELKQGLLTLTEPVIEDSNIIEKIVRTICAIANVGPTSVGKIIIGVTDKSSDADRIKKLYKIEPQKIGSRYVVGVNREAEKLKISVEKYFSKWKNGIRKSTLTPALRDAVLSNLDFNSFYGLGIIVISIPSQSELSYVGDDLYCRIGDATELVTNTRQIAGIARRFVKG